MLGLPFGVAGDSVTVNYPVFFLALAVLIFVIGVIIYLPSNISKYALLMGTIIGWVTYSGLFGNTVSSVSSAQWMLFPLGKSDQISISIVLTAILAGILNTSNTFGAMRGTDVFYPHSLPTKSLYRRSFIMSGLVTMLSLR